MKSMTVALALGLAFFSFSASAIPNPAAVFCVEKLKGTLEVREFENRGAVGFCKFKIANGTEYVIEEWTVFRFFAAEPQNSEGVLAN